MIGGKTSSHDPSRMSQLDGLRAIAVAGVVYAHWMPPKYGFNIPFAELGVLLFFVLSGYLISGIIFDRREGKFDFLRKFYIRRAIRIFPPYYLTVGVLIYLDVLKPPSQAIYHLAYISNIYLFFGNEWKPFAGHFWSLAVEEQFYLVWPALILFLSRATLLHVIWSVIAFSLISKLVVAIFFPETRLFHVLPVVAFDGMAAGGILAYAERSTGLRDVLMRWCFRIGMPILSICLLLRLWGINAPLLAMALDMAALAAFTALVGGAARGFTGVTGKVLGNNILVYIGTISYGIYIYHAYPVYVIKSILVWCELPLEWRFGISGLLMQAALTLLVASLSWHLLEFPIGKLKRYFPYGPSAFR